MSQRVRIINAITEIGTPALPAVLERIQVGTAWFYIRNLLKLLSGMGTAEHLDVLKPLVSLPNEKIPKAALNCAFDIGGEDRLKFFIQALNVTSDSVKSVAASLIGKLDNAEEGVFPLTQLLKEKATGPTEAKNALDIAICGSLKRIGSKKAIPALKAVSTAKGILGISAYSPELRSAATDALKHLQSLPTKTEKADVKKTNALDDNKKPATRSDAKTEDLLTSDPARLEALVDEYVRQKNTAEAVRLLYKMTVRFAKEKNFSKAEALREKLYQIDPMALSEIVKTGDIIEEEKNNFVVNDYQNIWGNLYERLTPEESNALFYNIKSKDYEPDQTLIAQHDKNTRLYFINRGQLKIVYTKGSDEFFLKILGAGDIAGEDTFFHISVSTVSLITLSSVKVEYIERDTLNALKNKYPQLEEKLMAYCSLDGGINALVAKKGLERRQQKRVALAGRTLVQLIDANEKPIGKPFRGSLMDISTGGISFVIKSSDKDTARLMLGRKLNMAIGILTKEDPIQIAGKGTIISAKEKKHAQFSLHLKFDSQLIEARMIDIVSNSIPM
jgi:CRP-like cAMP-binding protein